MIYPSYKYLASYARDVSSNLSKQSYKVIVKIFCVNEDSNCLLKILKHRVA
jgi:hypothetical protein